MHICKCTDMHEIGQRRNMCTVCHYILSLHTYCGVADSADNYGVTLCLSVPTFVLRHGATEVQYFAVRGSSCRPCKSLPGF